MKTKNWASTLIIVTALLVAAVVPVNASPKVRIPLCNMVFGCPNTSTFIPGGEDPELSCYTISQGVTTYCCWSYVYQGLCDGNGGWRCVSPPSEFPQPGTHCDTPCVNASIGQCQSGSPPYTDERPR